METRQIQFPRKQKSKNTLRFSGVTTKAFGREPAKILQDVNSCGRHTLQKQRQGRQCEEEEPLVLGKVTYPFNGYGWKNYPRQKTS
jgi:hypothetical protein